MYSQGPCPENAWLLPEGEDAEVYCECRDGFTFSPVEYNCQPTLSQPGHRLQSLWSNVAEYLERRRGQSGDVPSAEAAETGPSVATKRRRRWQLSGSVPITAVVVGSDFRPGIFFLGGGFGSSNLLTHLRHEHSRKAEF